MVYKNVSINHPSTNSKC